MSVATAAVGAELHRVTKSQRSINNSCGSSETVGDLVLLGRKRFVVAVTAGPGDEIGEKAFLLMLPLEPIPIFAVKEAGLRLVRGSSRSVE